MVLIPLYRPDYRSFWRDSPRGAARSRAFYVGAGSPFGKPSSNTHRAQEREAQELGQRMEQLPTTCMDAGARATHGAVAEAANKFVGNEFEQPKAGPLGRKPRMFFMKPTLNQLRVAFPLFAPQVESHPVLSSKRIFEHDGLVSIRTGRQ